jgi:uncharacterized protein (TIRG00374 family)
MSRTLRRIAFRVVLSAAFVWLALRGIRVRVVFDEIGGARTGWLLGALALLTVSFALGAARWRLLVRGQGVRLGAGEALRYTWIGLFFTNLLPSGFGGDAVRAWIAGRRSGALAAVTGSVLADRLTALWALVTLGALGVLIEHATLPSIVVLSTLLSCGAVAIGTVLVLAPGPARLLSQVTSAWPRGSRAVRRVGAALAIYNGRRDLLLGALGLSLAAQACAVLAALMLARALGLQIGVGLLVTTIPVALLATATPTSINGLGVREAVFRALLVPAGVAPSRAVAFSLLTVIAGGLVSLPGAAAWIALRRERARPELRLVPDGGEAALRASLAGAELPARAAG